MAANLSILRQTKDEPTMKDELPENAENRTEEGLSGKNGLLYAVFRCGFYRHECGGIFSDIEQAKKAAEYLKLGERDNHHSFEVVPFVLNEITDRPEEQGHYGWLKESDSLFSV